MVAQVGNLTPVPGQSVVAEYTDDEILGSYARLTQKGLTLKQAAGVTLATGTVLKVSSTPKKYAGAAKADVADAVGILRKGVDLNDGDYLANVVIGGVVKGEKVKYTDDTSLSAGELQTLAESLGGTYNTVHDYVVF